MTLDLESVRSIARTAGQEILNVRVDTIQAKEDGSPLTRADMASHRCIMDGLRNLSPAYPIISEEGNLEDVTSSPPHVFWLVDPLDGTKEFIKQNGEYTVNVALVKNGRPTLGIIHAPQPGWICWAEKGNGTWWQEPHDDPQKVTANRPSDAPLTAAVSRSHPSEKTEKYLSEKGIDQKLARGSSLKFCAVARGEADVYPRPNPTCLWDTAAGTAIAREAGCRVETLDGDDLLHDPANGIKHHGFIVLGPRMQ